MNTTSNTPPLTILHEQAGNKNANIDLTEVKSWREAAHNNTFQPIPVRSYGKEPVSKDWQHGHAGTFEATAGAANTGILCRGLRVIDNDVDDPGLASDITEAARCHLPVGALIRRRVGSSRYAMVYRAEGEPSKRSVSSNRGKVEVLGAGQHLLSHGIHPSGQGLTWDHDRSPATVAADDVPVVSEAQVETFLSACSTILGTERVTSRGNLVRRRDLGPAKEALENDLAAGIDRWHWFDGLTPSGKRELVKACLDAIDNRQHDPRDKWLSVLFAVADAGTRGS